MKNKKTIDFKGTVGTLSTLTVSLRSNQISALKEDLQALCGDTPDFFNEDLAILDASSLPGEGNDLDWSTLVALLRTVRLNPVAVRHASPAAEEKIRKAGLTRAEDIEVAPRKPGNDPAPASKSEEAVSAPSAVPSAPAQPELDLAPSTPSKKTAAKAATPPPEAAPVATQPVQTAQPIAPATTMVIDRPLRSGQQVYARNADLVVLAMVNPGAEVAADGNIHVYAPLRGRAMAGASGNTQARILTTCFEAELVSVGGVYRPLEPGMPKDVSGKPAQVRLLENPDGKQTLLIESLKIV